MITIVGTRVKTGDRDTYCDYISLKEDDKELEFRAPAITFASNKRFRDSFEIVPGTYVDAYELGSVKGKPGFVQVGKILSKHDKSGRLLNGNFKLSITRTKYQGPGITPHAFGCQILRNSSDMDELVRICKESGQKKFTYVLREE